MLMFSFVVKSVRKIGRSCAPTYKFTCPVGLPMARLRKNNDKLGSRTKNIETHGDCSGSEISCVLSELRFSTESDSKNSFSRSSCVGSEPAYSPCTSLEVKNTEKVRKSQTCSNIFEIEILYFDPWMPELLNFDQKIGFLMLKSVY